MTNDEHTWRDVVVDAMDSIDESTRIGAKVRAAILVVAFEYPREIGEDYEGSVEWFATAGASYERIGLLETTIDHLKGRLADADEGSDAA